jgi:RNA polymerase sigma-70 factor (ECF subfamily)
LSEETSKIDLPDTSKLLESFRNACHFGNATELIQELKKDIAAAISKKF